MSQTEKYNVATFMEKIVFAKSYSAQLARSIQGARTVAAGPEEAFRVPASCMIFLVMIDGSLRRPKLPRMPLRRPSCISPLRCSAAAFALLALLACERKAAGPGADSLATTSAPVAGTSLPARDRSGWNAAAGPALMVQGSALDEAIVLFPFEDDTLDQEHLDSASANGGAVTMFGRGGGRFSAILGALPDDSEAACERWLLRDVRPSANGAAWAVGFVDARVLPVPLDSVEVLTPRDSLALVAEASRLASAVTAPTGPSFQGLLFSAHDVRRFEATPGVQAFVAHLMRHVNQEANPQEEQTLLIAERDSGVTSGPYQLVYAERSFGREEEAVTPEVLAAVRLGGSPQPTLIVARDGDAGIIYALVERTGARRWRARWSSSPSRCN
jgi:hypothetical protein